MASILENVYIDELDDIVYKYNNKCHKTIKINSVDVNPSMYFDFNKILKALCPGHMLLVILTEN